MGTNREKSKCYLDDYITVFYLWFFTKTFCNISVYTVTRTIILRSIIKWNETHERRIRDRQEEV